MIKGSKNNSSVHRNKNDSNTSDNILNNPEILARVQDETDIRSKALKDYENLPATIKRRVRALKNLQLEVIKIEEAYYRELSKLEYSFAEQYQVIYNKRTEIVTGAREPTEHETQFECVEMAELTDELSSTAIVATGDVQQNIVDETPEKGIPHFWLTVLQHSDVIRGSIREHDINILKHLIDLKCVLKCGEENGFVLEFYFSPNEYFTDEKLTKEYLVKITASTSFPLAYEGPEIVRTKGCSIHWLPGKNITVKLIKKVQKSKNRREKHAVTKVVKSDSFFNFFDPPTESLVDDDGISPEVEVALETDFEIGQHLREEVIPRAVLLYTGEGIDDEYDDIDDDEDEDADESDQDVDGTDKIHDGAAVDPQQKPECKQQ